MGMNTDCANARLAALIRLTLLAFCLIWTSDVLAGSNRDKIYRTELKKLIPYKECVTNAAKVYKIPEWILLAILRHENGPLNGYLVNPNGTKDYGVSCINDVRIEDFHNAGIKSVTAERLMEDPCFAIHATAYLIKKEYLKEKRINGKPGENIWLVAAANYHYHYKGSYPKNHDKYKQRIQSTLDRFKTRLQ